MRVDESGQQRDVAEILVRARRTAGADAHDAIRGDLDPAVLDGRSINGKKPPGVKDSG